MRSPFRDFLFRITWQFTNTILLVVSVIAFLFLIGTPFVREVIAEIETWGYAGAFATGFFAVSTFTIVPATVVLFSLAHTLPPAIAGLFAGLGSVVGDYLIFRFVRDGIMVEWMPVLHRLSDSWLGRLFASPFFAWLLPLGGALVIASPLPDEFGISLLGLARLPDWEFLLLTGFLDLSGMIILMLMMHAL